MAAKKYKTSISAALGKKGLLPKQLGVPKDQKIPTSKLRALAKSGGKNSGKAQLLLNIAAGRKKKKSK